MCSSAEQARMDTIKHYHPAVSFSFFLLMVVLSLASMQPVFLTLSFLAAVSYSIAISGLRGFLRGSWWLIVLIAVVTLFNGVFGGRGLTVLFYLNLGFINTPITVESLTYGVCMGLMLANVILWFSVLGKLSSVQGFIELFARVSPTLGMMIARITVFIPELLSQARLVDKAQRAFDLPPGAVIAESPSSANADSGGLANVGSKESANADLVGSSGADLTASANANSVASSLAAALTEVASREAPLADASSRRVRKNKLAYASTLSSHLMEWGMEKSLITANSMVARGYGSRKRTSYRRTRLTRRDLVPLLAMCVFGVTSLVCIVQASVDFTFYPYLSELTFWWGYAPFLLLCCVPLALQLGEELAWWRSK